MHFFDAQAVATALPYSQLVEALASGLQAPIEVPVRSVLTPNDDDSCVLLMPAWKRGQRMGVKLVSVWPGNHALGLPAVSGVYVLMSCETGQPLAVMDGTELTLRRTAAAAALAARSLARKDSRTLAVLGTGALSVPLVQAHASVMPIERVLVWGRDPPRARRVVDQLQAPGMTATVAVDVQQTLAQADVVAVATTATQPFIARDWVRPGTHVGLVGAFTPQMAEADPALLAHAQVFADQRAAVIEKGGEVWQALQQGLITPSAIEAELAQLAVPDQYAWRRSPQSITVFKSVGFAALDLIAAEQVFQAHA